MRLHQHFRLSCSTDNIGPTVQSIQYLLVQRVNVKCFWLLQILRELAIHDSMLELNTKSWSDLHTRHLFYLHILFELADHDILQRFHLFFVLLSQVRHEHITSSMHLFNCSLLVIINSTMASITHIAVRFQIICILALQQKVFVARTHLDFLLFTHTRLSFNTINTICSC